MGFEYGIIHIPNLELTVIILGISWWELGDGHPAASSQIAQMCWLALLYTGDMDWLLSVPAGKGLKSAFILEWILGKIILRKGQQIRNRENPYIFNDQQSHFINCGIYWHIKELNEFFCKATWNNVILIYTVISKVVILLECLR